MAMHDRLASDGIMDKLERFGTCKDDNPNNPLHPSLPLIPLYYIFHPEEVGEEFGLKILTRSHHKPAERNSTFSLDFPPGLVHPLAECQPPKNRWRDLLQIIEGNKKQQTNIV